VGALGDAAPGAGGPGRGLAGRAASGATTSVGTTAAATAGPSTAVNSAARAESIGAMGSLSAESPNVARGVAVAPSAAAPSASVTPPSPSVVTPRAMVVAARAVESVALPHPLLPGSGAEGFGVVLPRIGLIRGRPEALAGLGRSLAPHGSAPARAVAACRASIALAASAYGGISVEAVAAGQAERAGGGLSVPVQARVLYPLADAYEVRQARVSCRIDGRGLVVAVL
jgi:hypothetical protein